MSEILNQIQKKDDIKKLNEEELKTLCKELRRFLLRSVSKTGGHLASNLGVVELTVALEYCFNLPEDKIVWDVGHQAYIHKILTGRKEQFATLRQLDGLSGFPKPHESDCDAFAAGHSSTSISAALGIAKARDLLGGKEHVIAVIGDGSMTGGLAYEALNNAGRENTNLIVILNDNQMSIDTNVGAISRHLNNLRTDGRYQKLKEHFKQFRDNVPIVGRATYNVLSKARDSAKHLFLHGAMFEELGFKYIGPVDGHDLKELLELFRNVKYMKGPVLIHVKTVKGRGYRYAEENPSGSCWPFIAPIAPFPAFSSRFLPAGKAGRIFSGRKCWKSARRTIKLWGLRQQWQAAPDLKAFRKRFPSVSLTLPLQNSMA